MAQAQRLFLQSPIPSLHPPTPKHSHQIQTPPFLLLKRPTLSFSLSKPTVKQTRFLIRATENDAQTDNEAQQIAEGSDEGESNKEEVSEIGMEIKKAMKEREKAGDNGFLSGVVEEIGQIEWPDFGKVLRTTGVVLGVIAGSSVVLLTLNAVLAELSDGVFAGKGVQDFFSG